jgi:hypothetical protein
MQDDFNNDMGLPDSQRLRGGAPEHRELRLDWLDRRHDRHPALFLREELGDASAADMGEPGMGGPESDVEAPESEPGA